MFFFNHSVYGDYSYNGVVLYFTGHNMLMVGVLGPRIPCEEVALRHVGQGKYTVTYRPSERGNHVLVVKWGDQHIPGSPFYIVVD